MRCPCCGHQVDDPEVIDYLRREDEEMISFIQESEEEWKSGCLQIGVHVVMLGQEDAAARGGNYQLHLSYL